MANKTVKDAKSNHRSNPQDLVEEIIRNRIYECKYWKEECFGLTTELLVDQAMELRYIGGVYGANVKPAPFLCLVLKMLEIQPEKDIILKFIKNDVYKYVRALGAFYMRLTGTSLDCYKYLEPLLNDWSKLRRQSCSGAFERVDMDNFIDQLLHEETACGVILPRLQKRCVLEKNNELQALTSTLEDDEDNDELEEMEKGEIADDKPTFSKAVKEDKRQSMSRRDNRHHYNLRDDDYYKRKDRRERRDERVPYRHRERDYSRARERRRSRERDYDCRKNRGGGGGDRRRRDRHRGRERRENRRDIVREREKRDDRRDMFREQEKRGKRRGRDREQERRNRIDQRERDRQWAKRKRDERRDRVRAQERRIASGLEYS